MDTEQYLREIMGRYIVDNLIEDKELFTGTIDMFMDGAFNHINSYSDEETDVQRDYSKVFTFGHNHDFGTFKVKGKMGDRHIKIIQYFIDYFGLPKDFSGKPVLDVGVWCGGTTLLLAGMNAKVMGIEEVEMYAKCAQYLLISFPFDYGNRVNTLNLFALDNYANFMNAFDYVIFPGVLYHLSDPVLGLRILFNALKDGGEIFIETATTEIGGDEPAVEYYGSQREGWNWFAPNSAALRNMLLDVGFTPYEKVIIENGRLFTKAKREEWKPMVKAGLSRRVR